MRIPSATQGGRGLHGDSRPSKPRVDWQDAISIRQLSGPDTAPPTPSSSITCTRPDSRSSQPRVIGLGEPACSTIGG